VHGWHGDQLDVVWQEDQFIPYEWLELRMSGLLSPMLDYISLTLAVSQAGEYF
jgi:hypothetical protein